MAYSSLADLRQLSSDADLLQLTDDQGVGSIDTARVDAAILRGDQRIDAYLAQVAPLPINPVPAILTQISAKFALIELHLRRQTSLSRTWAEEASRLTRYLEAVSKGREQLPGLALVGLFSPSKAKAGLPPLSNYPGLEGFDS